MSIHLNASVSRRRFLGGIAVLSFAGTSSLRSSQGDTETWAFLSDTHIDKDPDFVSWNGVHVADNLRRIIAEVLEERESLSGVLIDGDCALDKGLPGDYEVLAELLRPVVEAGLPLHLTLGNHDDRGPFFETFRKMRRDDPPVENKHVGVVESGPVNFVFLDSLRIVDEVEGEFGAAQREWLSRVLDDAPGKPTILVGHHYPQVFREDVIPADEPIKIMGLIDSSAFLDLVEERPQAVAYVCGHSHHWKVETAASGFHQVDLPPTAYVFDPERPSGWVRATVSPEGMRLELSSLDKDHPEHGQVKELVWRRGEN